MNRINISPAGLEHKHVASADQTVTRLGVAGQKVNICGVIFENNHTADVFIQMFDAALAADLTLGTTAATWSLRLPAGGAVVLDPVHIWKHFAKGCFYAVTSSRTNSTAPGANASLNFWFHQ